MPDELTIVRDLGATEHLPPELEQRLRQSLLEQIAAPTKRRPASGRRTFLRLAVSFVAVALVVAGGLLTGHGDEPSIAARAYAAISPSTGIMHFVAESRLRRSQTGEWRSYQEYWIDLAHPRRQRIVWSGRGRVAGQLVLVTRAAPGRAAWNEYPLTSVSRSPGPLGKWEWGGQGGIQTGMNPIAAYRDLLHSGEVLSEDEITYEGRDAYRLVIQFKPPYDLVDDVWLGDIETYIVDRQTYFPLEATFQWDKTFGGSTSGTRYPKFEILPDTPQTRALLDPVRNPAPYRP
jgi:hypothetical protein